MLLGTVPATMQITFITPGTRGDVQPAALVAAELHRRGHRVVLATADDLVPMGRALGLDTVPLGVDIRAFLRSDDGTEFLRTGGTRAYLTGIAAFKQRIAPTFFPAVIAASSGADVIVGNHLTIEEVRHIAGVARIPVVALVHSPRRSNRFFPAFSVSTARLPGAVNLVTHRIAARRDRIANAEYLGEFRRALGLTRRPEDRGEFPPPDLEVQAYSSLLVPELRDWSPIRPLTGFPRATAHDHARWGDAGVDGRLEEWLAAGEPPVFFGFGSMPVRDPAAMTALVDRVCEELGVRGLIGAGWSDFGDREDSERVRVVGSVDHAAVLPRCVVAVHHGGAGTTAEAVAAGIPSVVCAVSFDQPFWGQRLEDRGLGTWMPFAQLTGARLVEAIRPLLGPDARRRARSFRTSLAAEDGTRGAADAIEAVGAPARRGR